MWVAFANTHFSARSVYAIFNDQSFNNTLTNDIVSFEQLDPEIQWVQSLSEINICTLYICEFIAKQLLFLIVAEICEVP